MGKLNDESFIWYIRDALVILFLRKQRLRHSELDSESRVFAFAFESNLTLRGIKHDLPLPESYVLSRKNYPHDSAKSHIYLYVVKFYRVFHMNQLAFEFKRERGVVWVCDIANSAKYLNNEDTVIAFEEFIPRFHWLSRMAIDAAGGEFIKWTGDGFLAWFPTQLHRNLGIEAVKVLEAVWHLTIILNVTGLSVETDKIFRIRHGIAFEHDALLTRIRDSKADSFDILGRSIVLAFRMSCIDAKFPGIVTQREVVRATRKHDLYNINFKPCNITSDERLKYFKGERYGTNSIYISCDRVPKVSSKKSTLNYARKAIAATKGQNEKFDARRIFVSKFLSNLYAGPQWCQETMAEQSRFIQEELIGNIEKLISIIESSDS